MLVVALARAPRGLLGGRSGCLFARCSTINSLKIDDLHEASNIIR